MGPGESAAVQPAPWLLRPPFLRRPTVRGLKGLPFHRCVRRVVMRPRCPGLVGLYTCGGTEETHGQSGSQQWAGDEEEDSFRDATHAKRKKENPTIALNSSCLVVLQACNPKKRASPPRPLLSSCIAGVGMVARVVRFAPSSS
jgi:hypothetical protein